MTSETKSITQTLSGLEDRFQNLKQMQKELAEKRERLFPSHANPVEESGAAESPVSPPLASQEQETQPIVTSPSSVMSESESNASIAEVGGQSQVAEISAQQSVSKSQSMMSSSSSSSSKSMSRTMVSSSSSSKSSSSSSSSTQVVSSSSQSSMAKSMEIAEMSGKQITRSVQQAESAVICEESKTGAVVVGVIEKVTEGSSGTESITE